MLGQTHVQLVELRLVQRNNQFAASKRKEVRRGSEKWLPFVWESLLVQILVREIDPLDTQTSFEAAGRVVDARMKHTRIAARLVDGWEMCGGSEGRKTKKFTQFGLFFDQRHSQFGPRNLQLPGGRAADDPAAHNHRIEIARGCGHTGSNAKE